MAVRPAIDTLRNIGRGKVLDRLAIAINDACENVKESGKPATVKLELTFKPLGDKNVVEPTVQATGKVTKKLNEQLEATIFWLDEDNNPTTNKPKDEQEGLDLVIAGAKKHG